MYKNRTAYALAALLLFIVVITVVGRHGRNNRQFAQKRVNVTVETPEKAYDVWNENKVQGRILLLFDNVPFMLGLSKYDGIPQLSQCNLIEIGIFKNIIRKVYLIVPDQEWENFQQNNSRMPISQLAHLDKGMIIDNKSGIPIIATTLSSLPHLTEEPLVYINDQKFDDEKTMDLLSREKIVSDVIIRYRAR